MTRAGMPTDSGPVVESRPGVVAATPVASPLVAVVGLGYVGLQTALALQDAGLQVLGVDVSEHRLEAISSGDVDALPKDRRRLRRALADDRVLLTADATASSEADALVICVPTPIDEDRKPNTEPLERACATAVAHARAGQTLVLTSTTFVGSTRALLAEPLAARGLAVGRDVFVAFAPERILPGDASVDQREVPRVIAGLTAACTAAAARLLRPITKYLHRVSSPEAAELTKLHENTFRALNLAFANEMAKAALHFGVDPIEVVDAAATKPYGFLAHHPGPGVGGHCIPVDPQWMLEPLRAAGVPMPLAETAMDAVVARPAQVARRAEEILDELGVALEEASLLIVGVAYKPGVADARESPGRKIAQFLARCGAHVEYFDPLVTELAVDGRLLQSLPSPAEASADLVIVTVTHPGADYAWLDEHPNVLDATYRTPGGQRRHLI